MTCRRRVDLNGAIRSSMGASAGIPEGVEGTLLYDIQCLGRGRCDQCPGLHEPELCDDPFLRALKQECAGFLTDATHRDLPYPRSCIRYQEKNRCPLAWVDDFSLSTG